MKASQRRKEKKERKERLYRPRTAGERAASRRAALYGAVTLLVCFILLTVTVSVVVFNLNKGTTTPTNVTAPVTDGNKETESEPLNEAVYTVIIDPGHGGGNPGILLTDNTIESELTMSLAEEIAGFLREKGCAVVFTRTSDITEPITDEERIKNAVKGDCMISLHACVEKGVYYSLLSDTTEYSRYLAEYFGTPIAESEHIITRPGSVPCVLLGIDKATEAKPIAEGIMEYLERFVK